MNKSTWTVIGMYEDTGQVYSETVMAEDAYRAMAIVSTDIEEDRDTLCVLGAIQGDHYIVTPGEDNGSAAFAIDLIDLTEEN